MMFARCVSAVFTLNPSATATSLLLLPSASSCTISRWRGVRRLRASILALFRRRCLLRLLVQIAVQNDLGDLRREKRLIAAHGVYRSDQVAAGVRLQHIPARSGVEHFADQRIRLVLRQNENFRARIVLDHLARRFQAVQRRHADIEYGYVGLHFARLFDRFAPVAGFCQLPASPAALRAASEFLSGQFRDHLRRISVWVPFIYLPDDPDGLGCVQRAARAYVRLYRMPT